MRPIFTIHAGEFVFGEEIRKRFPNVELWIPAKDSGIDFLATNSNDRSRSLAIQVKMSRDYSPRAILTEFDRVQIAGGWFTFTKKALKESPADVWSLERFPTGLNRMGIPMRGAI